MRKNVSIREWRKKELARDMIIKKNRTTCADIWLACLTPLLEHCSLHFLQERLYGYFFPIVYFYLVKNIGFGKVFQLHFLYPSAL